MIRLISFMSLFILSAQAHCSSLLILGDSLSAGYQMAFEKAWPTLLIEEMEQLDTPVTVINGSVSGDTTANGVIRLPSLLSHHQPQFVLIELGANDGLQGFNPSIARNNLQKIIDLVAQSGATPILMQIRIPTNYGQRYSDSIKNLYPELAKENSINLIPFFLEGVITKPGWMKQDGIHPNELAQPWIAQFMATHLAPIIQSSTTN
ncbi:arylesterase [Vibrio sp. WJH972]